MSRAWLVAMCVVWSTTAGAQEGGGVEEYADEFDDIDTSEFDDFDEEPADDDDAPAPPAETPAPPADTPTGTPPAEDPAPAETPAPVPPPAQDPSDRPAATDEPEVEVEVVPPPAPPPEEAPAAEEPAPAGRRLGDPVPLTRREPLLGQFGFEADIHYGLVGTGPTRLTNDVRFGIFDWWELRTTLAPYPAGLMTRFKIGSQQGLLGALIVDGGLSYFDAGFRLVEDAGEPQVGFRWHFEAGLAYARALGDRFSIYWQARFRYRLSLLSNDNQNAISTDLHLTYDLLDNLAITAGLGYAEVVGTKVRELSVTFVNVDRPGINHFLLRDDGWSRSVTIPIGLTYGRIESFDVDVFVTPRVWPQFDIMFGAGVRWRIPSLPRLVGLDW